MRARLRNGQVVAVTDHALERYVERVLAFGGDRARAEQHLSRLVAEVGSLTRLRPEWACSSFGNPADRETDCYLMLGPDIALPVCQGRAVTVLARGHMSDVARVDRNRRNRAERQRRRYQRIGLPGSRPELGEAA